MPLARRSWSSIVSPPVIPGWCASNQGRNRFNSTDNWRKDFLLSLVYSHTCSQRPGRREMELIDPAQPAANSKGGLVAFDGFEGDGSAELSDAHNSGR